MIIDINKNEFKTIHFEVMCSNGTIVFFNAKVKNNEPVNFKNIHTDWRGDENINTKIDVDKFRASIWDAINWNNQGDINIIPNDFEEIVKNCIKIEK